MSNTPNIDRIERLWREERAALQARAEAAEKLVGELRRAAGECGEAPKSGSHHDPETGGNDG
jgi:hypothetical protein